VNPYFRYLLNTVMDRFTAVDSARTGRIRALLSKEHNVQNYLIIFDSKPCGFCCIRKLSRSSWRMGPFGVLNEYRGLGLGRFMVEEVKKIVNASAGKYVVTGVVIKQTHEMFLKMGFQDVDAEWNMVLDV
jgi:predicted acetyltransferase